MQRVFCCRLTWVLTFRTFSPPSLPPAGSHNLYPGHRGKKKWEGARKRATVTGIADEGGAVDRIKRTSLNPTGSVNIIIYLDQTVFCRLYPFFSRLYHSSVWVLPVISLLLTNTVLPVRACLIIWCERLQWTPRGQCILFSVVFTHSPPGTALFGSYLSSLISLLLTNTISPVRACLIICFPNRRRWWASCIQGAQAWDIRLQGFYGMQACIVRRLRN
jgi:hypothetical protein